LTGTIAPLTVLSREAILFDIRKDIQSMTTFRRNPAKFMKHLKKTKKPLVLTINGKAEAVVQAPKSISACWISRRKRMHVRESGKAGKT
jgi:hypothetical protein